MGLGIDNYTNLSPETTGYLYGILLKRSLPLMPFEPFVTGKTLPANETKTMRFRRLRLDYATAIDNMYINEGIVPPAQQTIQEDVTVTLKQIAALVKITDVIEDTHTNRVLNETFINLGEIAPRLVELDRFYALRACTNKYYTNGAARSAVNTPLSGTVLRKAVRNLERNVAMKVTSFAKTSPDFNTENMAPAYIAVGHVDLRKDIEDLPGFTYVANYPSNVKVFPGEIGALGNGNIRFILTSLLPSYPSAGGAKGAMISTDGISADVYPLIIFGKDAWDSVALKGQFAVKPIVVNPSAVNQSNPLGQFGFCGFKTMQGSLIANDQWMTLVEAAATELS